jgi:hypothetical protein
MLLVPQPVRMNINDGLGEDLLSNAPHWEVARMLLDQVRPAGDAERRPVATKWSGTVKARPGYLAGPGQP